MGGQLVRWSVVVFATAVPWQYVAVRLNGHDLEVPHHIYQQNDVHLGHGPGTVLTDIVRQLWRLPVALVVRQGQQIHQGHQRVAGLPFAVKMVR